MIAQRLSLGKDAEFFAYHQYRDYVIFSELAKRETVPAFKSILEQLVVSEYKDYSYWLQFCSRKEFHVPRRDILFFLVLRRMFGLTFTAKFLERDEKEISEAYRRFMQTADEPLRTEVAKILEHEREHELMLIRGIREGKVQFLGSIILGLNDGLVELTGVLIGFSFALQQNRMVGILGLITGVSAAFSMSASAYLQARYDRNRDPATAALYTGSTYLVVVVLLVAPFFLVAHASLALICFAIVVAIIILITSFYASVMLERRFTAVVCEMAFLSIGVALLSFVLVSALKSVLNLA
ncbi:VIT1/CCC1 transporter family protein [Candidatus Uhrbacteria bacterium]|nr:VIT1/CCC1 transporter family protein [Candidatus Uhrbacteria bacterium]